METKKIYSIPSIESIVLDNDISLQLQSAQPPSGPDESQNLKVPEYFNNSPFA
ncbi:MAG: hypothetical protein GZ091_09425 [Paludibacter sp.]|nr:hypothetical protein [Paludibacter sp.]